MSSESAAPEVEQKPRLSPRVQTHIAQAVVAAFGAATVILSIEMRLWVSFGPGPGFFPFTMGVLLLLLSLLWVIEAHRQGYEVAESVSRRRTFSIIGSLLVLVLLMEPVGFQLSMLLFLFFHLKVMGRQKWITTIIVAVVGSFGAFALFNNVLGVRLPVAELPFLQSLGL